jgi:hypothetical protein
MRLLALAIALAASTAHAADPTDTRCRSSTIAKTRQQALEENRTAGRPRAAAALAAYDRLKPALDADCLSAAHSGSPTAPPMDQDAIAYAWLLNDASAYLIAAGDSAPPAESGSAACLDALQPLLGDDMRPRPGFPQKLRAATSANVLQCSAHCLAPSCKPANVSIWSAYRSESSAYMRHPACADDARLIQLNANTCVGFDAGVFAAPHPSEDAGELACDAAASKSDTRCPAMLVLTREPGRNTTRRFPPAKDSALSDPSTACAVRSTGIDASGARFALIGEGRDCFGGTAYSLIEEIYVLRDGQPVLVKKNSADF